MLTRQPLDGGLGADRITIRLPSQLEPLVILICHCVSMEWHFSGIDRTESQRVSIGLYTASSRVMSDDDSATPLLLESHRRDDFLDLTGANAGVGLPSPSNQEH